MGMVPTIEQERTSATPAQPAAPVVAPDGNVSPTGGQGAAPAAAAESAEQSEYRRHRDETHLPNHVGMVALVLAIVAVIMSMLVLLGTIPWYTPLLATGAAIATAIWALTRRNYRKLAAVVALILSAISLIPPTAAYALASSVTPTGTNATATDATPVTPESPLTSIFRILGQDGNDGQDGQTGTDGTPGAPGTPGDAGTDPGTGVGVDVNVGTGGPLIDANVDVPAVLPPVVAVATGALGSLLTTPTGVSAQVSGVTCGLPLVNALGIQLPILGQLCAVNLSVTNNSDHAVVLDSSAVTGISGSTSVLADATLGLNPLSAQVAPGASANGTVYVKLASASAGLDKVQIRLGGEPASSLLTVAVH